MDILRREYDYFNQHIDELVILYPDRYVVIKNCQILGNYENTLEAVRETLKTEKLGSFIVQHCNPNTAGAVQMFHSRVSF